MGQYWSTEPQQNLENGSTTPISPEAEISDRNIRVSQLWIYPLKSARGIRVPSARLYLTGFEFDRQFMLVEEITNSKGEKEWKAMTYRLYFMPWLMS
jgi:MOSC N-terminal beta barrel domain